MSKVVTYIYIYMYKYIHIYETAFLSSRVLWFHFNLGNLRAWGFGVLGFWGFGVLGCWGVGVLGFWGFGVLGFWGVGILGFTASRASTSNLRTSSRAGYATRLL